MARIRAGQVASGVLLALVGAGLFVAMPAVQGHPGGRDQYGCHRDTAADNYHCHDGPLAGGIYTDRAEMLSALAALTAPTPGTAPPDPDPLPSVPAADGLRIVCQFQVSRPTWTIYTPGGSTVTTTEPGDVLFQRAFSMLQRDSGLPVIIKGNEWMIALIEQPAGVELCPGQVAP